MPPFRVPIYLIPKYTLLSILGRSEPWLESIWNDRRVGPMPERFHILDALVILSRCPKRTRVWKCSIEVRLPLPTWQTIRRFAENAKIKPEDFCRALTCRSIDEIRQGKIDLNRTQPHMPSIPGSGGKVRFRKFVVYGMMGLRIIATAYKTSISTVLNWMIGLWMEKAAQRTPSLSK